MHVVHRGGCTRRSDRFHPWLRAAAAAAVSTAIAATAGAAHASADSSPSPTAAAPASAIGNEAVIWIAVSPAYTRTGTVVVASASLSGCPQGSTDCSHLWVSRDGGHSWARARAQGWNGLHPLVAVDGAGKEVMYGSANSNILRSDDYGNTWKAVGPSGGTPTPAPTYDKDGALAVAGKSDYVLRGTQSQNVNGSGGTMGDAVFAYSPTHASGNNPPALLAGTDPKSGLPAVQHCTADLSCSGTALLNGAGPMAGTPTLYLSSDFGNDGGVFAQTASGVFKSTNGGGTFVPMPIGASGATATSTAMMALAPGYSEKGPVRTAYVAVMQAFGSGKDMKRNGGVFRTTDGGTTWNAVGNPGPMDEGVLAVAAAPDGRLFAAFLTSHVQGGLLCSTDGGVTWQVACPVVGTGSSGGSGVSAAKATNAPGCSGSACAAAGGGATPAATAAAAGDGQGALPGTGSGAAPGTIGGTRTGTPASPSRPWLIPAIIAIALSTAAGVTAVVRRRGARSQP
jgi:photosystem II stability/assembly factor-like uncharacterized protein